MPSKRLKIYFDGGCRPNPGPIETAVVVRGVSHVRTGLPDGDNSEAEWRALIDAVGIAVRLGLDDVVFVGDSALVINQANGRWPCRAARLQACLAKLREMSAALPRAGFRQVPRSRNLAGIVLDRLHSGLDEPVRSPPR
jgi:ribonuclease HI